MYIFYLFIHCVFLFLVIQEDSFYIIAHGRDRRVFADIQRLDQPLSLTVLRYDRKTVFDLIGNTLYLQVFPVVDHLAGMFRAHSHKALKQLAPACSQKTVNPQYLSFFQIHTDVVQQISAALFRQA